MANKPMTVTSREVTLRDFVIFQLKLALDGLKDVVVFNVSIVAVVLDFIAGRGRRPRLFYSVVRASERFDHWLNLHGVMERFDETGGEDGLFGASEAGSDSLIGQIEKLVRGGDEPRGARPPSRPLGSPPVEPDAPEAHAREPGGEATEQDRS
ncbi:MAG TPA: hypothetical protein VLA09_12590 [Longimicrobiales bacterium]|nr:hypothetical protein [Longimicrobiales bacterium]